MPWGGIFCRGQPMVRVRPARLNGMARMCCAIPSLCEGMPWRKPLHDQNPGLSVHAIQPAGLVEEDAVPGRMIERELYRPDVLLGSGIADVSHQ